MLSRPQVSELALGDEVFWFWNKVGLKARGVDGGTQSCGGG